MRSIIPFCSAILTLALLFGSTTANAVQFRLAPVVSMTGGNSTYVMDLRHFDNLNNIEVGIKSELIFPLGAPVGGGRLLLNSSPDDSREWEVELNLSTNLVDPSGKMTDRDWLTHERLPDLEFSNTESKARMRMLNGSISGKYTLVRKPKASIGALIVLSYQNIDQKIIGFSGWYLDENSIKVNIRGTRAAINYEVTYISPRAGGFIKYWLNSGSSLEFQSSLGLVLASDVDDHLIRGKISDADATGLAFSAGLELNIRMGNQSSKTPPTIFVAVRYQKIRAEGDQTQRWYEDEIDPTDPEQSVFAGDVFTGIPHEFISSQYGLQLGVSFGL